MMGLEAFKLKFDKEFINLVAESKENFA